MPGSCQLHVDACDVNTLANAVYRSNFGDQPRTFDLNLVRTSTNLDPCCSKTRFCRSHFTANPSHLVPLR